MTAVSTPFGMQTGRIVRTVAPGTTLASRPNRVEMPGMSFQATMSGRAQRTDAHLAGVGWFNTTTRAVTSFSGTLQIPGAGASDQMFLALGMTGADFGGTVLTTVGWNPGSDAWEASSWFARDDVIVATTPVAVRAGAVVLPEIRLTGRDAAGLHYVTGLAGIPDSGLHLVTCVELKWLHAGLRTAVVVRTAASHHLHGLRVQTGEVRPPTAWTLLHPAGRAGPHPELIHDGPIDGAVTLTWPQDHDNPSMAA